MKLEAVARESIDAALAEAGWAVQDIATFSIGAVDRANLGQQTKEFQAYVTPDDGRKFTEL